VVGRWISDGDTPRIANAGESGARILSKSATSSAAVSAAAVAVSALVAAASLFATEGGWSARAGPAIIPPAARHATTDRVNSVECRIEDRQVPEAWTR
jgi:hypothetical protein